MLDGLTPDLGSRFLLATGAVGIALIILVLVLMALRRRNAPLFVRGGKNREPRLAVLDAAAVDTKRRLVLIRRDNVEHLIMIGGPTDIVIESGIGLDVSPTAISQQIPERSMIEDELDLDMLDSPARSAPARIEAPRTEPVVVAPVVAAPVVAAPMVTAEESIPPVVAPPVASVPVKASEQPIGEPVSANGYLEPGFDFDEVAPGSTPVAAVPPRVFAPAPEPVAPVVPPVSAAASALYGNDETETDAEREERELAALLEKAAEQRAAATQPTFAAPPPVTPTAAANSNPLASAPIAARPVPTPQDNPVQPAGIAQGQIVRRTEQVPPVRSDTAEDILDAARSRVLAAARLPGASAGEPRQAPSRIEPAFATDPALRAPKTVQTTASAGFAAPSVNPPVQQQVPSQMAAPLVQSPALQAAREKSKEELALEFERILEAEMAASGLEFDEPVTAQPIQPVPTILPPRPANMPPVTGATPDNALEREMQRLLAQHDLDQSEHKG